MSEYGGIWLKHRSSTVCRLTVRECMALNGAKLSVTDGGN